MATLSIPSASGIYVITCTANGKIYIGSTKDFRKRWNGHRSDLRAGKHRNCHLQAAWIKYGEQTFTFRILEECESDALLEREDYYIRAWKAAEIGFNIAVKAGKPPSASGRKHTHETRAKISASARVRKILPETRTSLNAIEKDATLLPGIIIIPLTQSQVTIIDETDADLAQHRWHASFNPTYSNGGAFKAARTIITDGKKTTEWLHRVILSRVLGRPLLCSEQVDFIHGFTLDNRRSELRLASSSQNSANQSKQRNNTSGFRGVSWQSREQKWVAQIQVNRKRVYLGCFDAPEEAYGAYCDAARKYHGEFARFD